MSTKGCFLDWQEKGENLIPNPKVVGGRLASLREKKGISKADAARICGVSRQAYGMYESGKRTPADSVKKVIADTYGVTVDSIFFKD